MANGHGGRRSGAGRKSAKEEMGLALLLRECWTTDQRKRCIEAMALKASDGDEKAARLLFEYAWGRPKQVVEMTGKDGGPIETRLVTLSDEELERIATGADFDAGGSGGGAPEEEEGADEP